MQQDATGSSAIISLIVLVIVGGLIILRNSRPRRLRVELLWVRGAIILLGAAAYFAYIHPKSLVETLGLVVAFAIGGGIGWWRGSLMRIEVDPATHTAMQQASPLGMLLILGLFGIRYAVRLLAFQNAASLPVSAMAIAGWLLALAVGIVVLTQIEIWLRARRLVGESKSKAA
jgi:hypothetical protein